MRRNNMKRVDNWDSIQAVTNGGEQLPAGVYKVGIVRAEAGVTKTNKEKMVLALEITDGDYQGIFSRKYKSKKQFNENAAWPCLFHQVTEGDSLGRYKALIMAIEASNPGYKWDFDETTLKGKEVGCVFREEEYIGQQDGKVHSIAKPYQFIPLDEMDKATVPEKKCIDQAPPAGGVGGYDEDIPF
jgi:hypothetical protein